MKKTDNKTADTYETTNFHIASWFLMNDVPLIDVNWSRLGRTGRERATFVFETPESQEELVSQFFQEELLQKKITSDQELKRIMYANHSPVEYER